MISHLYQNSILKNPKSVFIVLLITLISFGYYSKDFRLDASSETLLLEGDPDLKYLKEITNRYGSKEFLVLTYTPNQDMVSDSSVNNLLSLKYKLQSLDWVHSVITLLDVPLLNNSDEPLQDRLNNFKTLKDEKVDRERGFKEILSSPVVIKIGLLKFNEIFPNKSVIFESTFSFFKIKLYFTILNKDGSKVKVIIKEVTNPKVIIQPKSIIGFISLKINDKKAIIVVKAV